jgi:hypothetical protein
MVQENDKLFCFHCILRVFYSLIASRNGIARVVEMLQKQPPPHFYLSEYKFRTSVHFWLNICNETSQNKRVFNRTQSWYICIILILACKQSQHPGTSTRKAAPQFIGTNRTEGEKLSLLDYIKIEAKIVSVFN